MDFEEPSITPEDVVRVLVKLEAFIAGFNGCPVGTPGASQDVLDHTGAVTWYAIAGRCTGRAAGRQAESLGSAVLFAAGPGDFTDSFLRRHKEPISLFGIDGWGRNAV